MHNPSSKFLAFATMMVMAVPLCAQRLAAPKPEETEVWKPVPRVVTPGATDAAPPSDAIVLFDGKNLNEWVSTRDKSPAQWTLGRLCTSPNSALCLDRMISRG
jgi:hypothetical protein